MRKVPAVAFSMLVCASTLFAWGEDGHRIVCRIAYQSLSIADRQEVNRLTKLYQTPSDTKLKINSFPDGCVFADEARSKEKAAEKEGNTTSVWMHFKPFNNWHFLNVGREVTTIDPAACNDDCVLTGIEREAAQLQSATTDHLRAESLLFLGHFVGDVHQPLHVSFASDQGGNLVQPVTGGFYPPPKDYPLSLHSIWDSGIIRKDLAGSDWLHAADRLEKKITKEQRAEWSAAPPLAWAQESYELTTTPDVLYCQHATGMCQSFGNGRELTDAYQQEFADDVERRLQKAGVRLAATIHAALQHP